jgi:phage shock protein A
MTTIAVLIVEPDAVQHEALAAYAARYAEAGTWLARKVFDSGISDQVRLHRLFYSDLRERFDLPAQSAVLCLKHTARLCRRAETAPELAWNGPVPYDRHLYRLKSVDVVSLATLGGRVVVPCTIASYQRGEFTAGSGELRYEADQWIFSLRTALSEAALHQTQIGREPEMSDKLLSRIARIVAGITHNAVTQAEQAAAVPVMEQAIRDIDQAVKDVRAEIGQNEATKYNAGRRIGELQSERDGLDRKIALALREDKEELTEAGVGRQLDIENQLALLQRTLREAEEDIAKLSGSINALQASRREAQQRLQELKRMAQVAGGPDSGNGPGNGMGGGRSAASKAAEAIDDAQRIGESLTGLPAGESRISHKDLDELAELHRQHEIRERLAKHKAGLKAGA